MITLTPYEEKILRYFRKNKEIPDFINKFGLESLDALQNLYSNELIDGSFEISSNYKKGNFTDFSPSGKWLITNKGKLYFRESNASKNKRVKDLLFENLIAFGFGLISGLVIGISVGLLLPE